MPSARRLAFFFGSGACALVYPIVWMRALALTMSVTVYTATTVLCAFMAGLGLAAAIAGRLVGRLARPLWSFGLVETGIGCAGLGTPQLLFGVARAEI